MKKLPWVLALGVLLLVATCSYATLTPEKAAYLDAVNQAKALFDAGVNLTPDQISLLEDEGIIRNERNELDLLGGPDAFGYSFVDSNEPDGPVYEWVDVSETGTEVTNWADDINLGPFEIGFDFPFYGEMYTQFWVCSNGWLTFSNGMGTTYTNRALPDATTPNNAIYWSWDDWTPVGADVAWYGLDDDGNCVFQCGFAVDGPGTLDSEIILYPDGTIKLQYGPNFSIRNNSSTIGIENLDGSIGLQVLFNNNVDYPSPEMAIQFELLDMGFVAGQVTDLTSLEPVPGAEVTLLADGEFFRSAFADEEGMYSMLVEIGDYDIFASAFGYIPSDPEPVTVIMDETVTVNIGIDRAPAPEISVDPEALNFTCAWLGTDSDVMTISNIGGDDLDWFTSVEFVEEDMAQELRQAKPWPAPYQVPMNLNVASENDLVGASEEKIEYYQNVQDAYNALKNNIPLKLEQRNLLLAEGIIPQNNELDMTGEDEFGYILTDSEEPDCPDFEWIDISETGTAVTNWSDDTNIGPFELGFEFPFYGEMYTQFWLCSNGFLTFSAGQGSTWTNRTIPDTNVPNNAIHWCWDDWRPDPGDNAWYGMDADGNFVIQFDWVNDNFAGVNESEIILYPNGAIKLQFGQDFVVRDNNVTIGLENADGTIGLEAVFNNNVGYPAPETVILFHLGEYTGGWMGLDPSRGTLAPQGEQEVIVTADASIGDLDPGTYEAIITVATDYPNVDPVAVWATMTVLEPGSIAGTVTNSATGEALPGAEIRRWIDDVEFVSYFCDEFGAYTFPIGEGTHTLTAVTMDYYESLPVDVDVLEGEITQQDFALNAHVPPEITADPEALNFVASWMGTDSDILTITNTGGLDLNWDISVEYVEEELMAGHEIRQRVRENFQRTMPDPAGVTVFDASTVDYKNYPSTPAQERYNELDDPYFLLVQDTNPWGYTSNQEVLDELQIPYDLINSASLAETDLDDYTAIMCAGLQNTTYYTNLAANYEDIVDFIEGGGWFQFCGSQGSAWTLWDGTHSQTGNYSNNFILVPDHPMLIDLPDPIVGNSANHGSIADYPEDAVVLMEDNAGNAVLLEYRLGRGNVLLSTQTWEFYWRNGNGDNHPGEVLRRACAYTAEGALSGWLYFEPNDGTLVPDAEAELVATADAAIGELGPGTYEAIVTIEADHHLTPAVTVWATLTVLDPGSIEGTVTDEANGAVLPGAEIRVWGLENTYVSYYCNDEGFYSFPIGAGEFELTAITADYYESESVMVTVEEGVVSVQDFTLDHHIPPEITVTPEFFNWEVEWLGNTTDIMTVGNIGGLDLNYRVYVEYIEEEVAAFEFHNRIREIQRNFQHPVHGTTIYTGPSSDDIVAFPVEQTVPFYSELDDPYFLLFQDQTPWNNSHQEFLNENEIPFDVVGSAMFADQELDEYTVVMCPSTQSQAYYDAFAANGDRYEDWVNGGGWLEFHGCTQGATWTLWDGTAYVHQGDGNNTVVEPDHPIVAEIPLTFTGTSANHGWMDNIPEDALVIITDSQERPVLIETRSGRGNMIVTTETWEFGVNANQVAGDVMHNAILYSAEGAFGTMGWLMFEPDRGIIPPDGQEELTAFVDAAPDELNPGTYEAMITVEGDHPGTESVTIFATLLVGSPGTIEGTVSDIDGGFGLAGAEVIVWDDMGEYFRSTFTDENGDYSMFIGQGTWDLSAHIADYYDSDVVEVVAVNGVITVQDFDLAHHIPPTIDVDREFITFISPPMGTDTEELMISNNGGLTLHYDIGYEYIDDAEMARNVLATGSIFSPVKNAELDEVSEVVLPTEADLAEMTPRKADYYRNVQSVYDQKINGELLNQEERQLLEQEGLVNPLNELDNMGGPDAFGYLFTDSDEGDCPDFDWIDISETGTAVTNWSDDTNIGPFQLGFEFPFYGEFYTQFWLCSNGFLTFSAGQGSTWTNRTIPDTNVPNNAIHWCWDDWRPDPGDNAWYGMDGDGNFVIQFAWVNDNFAGVNDSEIVLYPNGAIKIQYGPDFVVRDNNITIGLENATGTVGLQAVFNNNVGYPAPESVILFHLGDYTGEGWLSSDPDEGILEIGEDTIIEITADSEGAELAEGIYEAMIQIEAEHPDTPPTIVWAEYIVGAGGIFHPVPPNGLPYPIVVDEVLLNGFPVGPDAGIAVYDGDLCVGAFTTTEEWPRALLAMEADPDQGLAGFTAGNEMSFMVWTEGLDDPIPAYATYIEGDGTFGALPYTQLSLNAAEIPTLDLRLHGNYFELISTCIAPEDMNAASVFGDIADLAIVYEDNGSIYIPTGLNTIGDIDVTQGNKIFCFENSSLLIQGEYIDPATSYPVTGGVWNWMGYPFPYGVAVNVALAEIVENVQIVMTDDGRIWIPNVINSIGNMAPGEGYFIFPTADLDVVYNDGAILAAGGSVEYTEMPAVEEGVQSTGLPYATLVRLSEEALALDPATIEIYDGNLLVGKSVVSSDQDFTPVISWEGDANYNLAGFTPGNNMRFIVRSADGSKLPVILEGSASVFGEGAYANVSMKVAEMPTEFAVEQGYPNPFNPSVTVPFALPASGEVSIAVYNVLGQQVFQNTSAFEAGYHRFTFNANNSGKELVSGMYFLKVEYQGQISSQKLMLLK